METITWGDFEKVQICVGTIARVDDFPEAKKPAYKLTIYFGDNLGVKKSSAQLTKHYTKESLLNKLVLCVVNFPTRQIGPFMSEVLTLGVPDENGDCILITPDKSQAVIGGSLF